MIVFLDMDGVLADFDGALPPEQQKPVGTTAWDPPAMFEPGFFRNLKPMPGAKEAVAKLLAAPHLDVYIGSKPTTKNTLSATEKYDWIAEHFPDLLKKIVLVCDKKLLRGHVLVDDDRQRWEPVFDGRFIYFDRGNPEWSWAHVVGELCGYEPCPECGAEHNRFHHTRIVDAA